MLSHLHHDHGREGLVEKRVRHKSLSVGLE